MDERTMADYKELGARRMQVYLLRLKMQRALEYLQESDRASRLSAARVLSEALTDTGADLQVVEDVFRSTSADSTSDSSHISDGGSGASPVRPA